MIEILTQKGEKYSYDPSTDRIFKDGYLIPSSIAEPIFSNTGNDLAPKFSGIYLKDVGMILSLSGKYSQISNPNFITT